MQYSSLCFPRLMTARPQAMENPDPSFKKSGFIMHNDKIRATQTALACQI